MFCDGSPGHELYQFLSSNLKFLAYFSILRNNLRHLFNKKSVKLQTLTHLWTFQCIRDHVEYRMDKGQWYKSANCVQNGSKSSDWESSWLWFVERLILSLRTFWCSKHWKLMSENEAKQVSMPPQLIGNARLTAAPANFTEYKVSASRPQKVIAVQIHENATTCTFSCIAKVVKKRKVIRITN